MTWVRTAIRSLAHADWLILRRDELPEIALLSASLILIMRLAGI